MDVDAGKVMFMKSEQKHDVKYTTYDGCGDGKTFEGILNGQSHAAICLSSRKKEYVRLFAYLLRSK